MEGLYSFDGRRIQSMNGGTLQQTAEVQGQKCAPALRRPLQVQHGPAWNRTRTSTVTAFYRTDI